MWSERRSAMIAQMTCEQLMAELHTVGMDHIALVALEYPELCSEDGLSIWSLVGGWHGLRGMYANTSLLLALAEQAGAWDKRASNVALEAMKQDLLLLRWSVVRSVCDQTLVRGLQPKRSDVYGVATAYHHMTELLLDLYRRSPSRFYTHLETAIWRGLGPRSLSI